MRSNFILFAFVFLALTARGIADEPPPPSFNPDAGAPPEAAQSQAPSAGALAAPQITEEQMIRNDLEIAYQLYHAEDYDACSKKTGAILDKYPKKKLFWVRYLDGLCQEHLELYEKAIDQFNRVKKDAPRSTYAHAALFRIGLCQIKAHEVNDAIYSLREIIETDPHSEYRQQAYIHLGNLYRSIKDWKAAERIYKDLIRLFPETSWAHSSMLYLAECFSFEGKTEKAIKVYEEMQRTASVPMQYRAQAQLRVGELLLREKRWQDSIGAFRMAIRDYSDIPGIRLTADEKILQAQEGRRSGNVPYKQPRSGPQVSSEAPADEAYRLKQQKEALPY